ncbi:MAG: signal peptidase I, partial [Patescibacteria group bacterium]
QNKIYINGKVLNEKYIERDIFTGSGAFLQEGKTVKIPEDNYFVMGDNRSHSSDSRSWGFIPKNDISGRAWFVYWPISLLGTVPKVNYSL